MKKFTTIMVLLIFVFSWASIPDSFAEEGVGTTAETEVSSSAPADPAAASAASVASEAGISNSLIEGGLFAAAVAIMAVAIASGSDFEPTPPNQGHGH